MRAVAVATLCALVFIGPACGQNLAYPNAPFPHSVDETPAHFAKLIAAANPPARDQFETEAEYKARTKPPAELFGVRYFAISEKAAYAYDIPTETLTVQAGDYDDDRRGEKSDLMRMPQLRLSTSIDDNGTRKAQNGYGASVTVREFESRDYSIACVSTTVGQLARPPIEPDQAKKRRGLTMRIKLPRDAAKELAPNLKMICGVKFGPRSVQAKHITERVSPTFDNPIDATMQIYSAAGDVVSLHVVDSRTNTEIARWAKP
jgi:hypothetical protein